MIAVKKSVKELYADIGKLITSSLKLNMILQRIMEEIHLYFNPEYWSLLRLDSNTNELYFVIFNGPVSLKEVKDIRLKLGEGIAGAAARDKEAYFVPDTEKESNFCYKVDNRTGFKTKSVIAVPLVCREKVYGVIEIVNPIEEKFFSEEEFFILSTIADFSAIAFANSALYESVIQFSYTDPLTGVSNRTKFDDLLKRWEKDPGKHRRSPENDFVSVIAVDMNNFKDINDTYGHLTGDDVLREAASFFKACIREDDILFRLGGDEFVIILESVSPEHLTTARERIIELLEKGNGQKLSNDIALDYAYGYATGKRNEIGRLVDAADSMMYSSKKKSNGTTK